MFSHYEASIDVRPFCILHMTSFCSSHIARAWGDLHMPASRVFTLGLEVASQLVHCPVSLRWSEFYFPVISKREQCFQGY